MFHSFLEIFRPVKLTKHIRALISLSCLVFNSSMQGAPEPPPVIRPIDEIIEAFTGIADSHGFQAARNHAATLIASDGTRQGYHSKKKDEFISFQGSYTFPTLAADEIGKYRFGLALFSDDGCQLKIQESPAPYRLLEYGTPQALPNTEESFEVFYDFFDPGQTVTMDVWYSNVKFIESGGDVDIDGCTLFVVKRPYIDLAISPIGEEPELPEDRNAGASTHEMNPGGVVLAPVTVSGNQVSSGKRTKITLRAGHKPEDGGKFELSASAELSKIKIYTSKDGTEELPLPLKWDSVSDFLAATQTYYIGSEASTPEEQSQSGTLTLLYRSPHAPSNEYPSITDQVKVTIQTGNQVVIRPSKGTDKTKLIIPIPENASFPKLGQMVEVQTYLSEDFEGHVEVTNKNPEEISLWKSKDGSNGNLGNTFTILIQAGKLVPTAEAPQSFFANGIKEATQALLEAKLVKANDPNFVQTANLNASVVEVGMREIVFDKNGAGYIPLTRDDATPFPATDKPHWIDTDKNGVIDPTKDETNDSVAYVKNSAPRIGSVLKMNLADTHAAKIRAKCPDQMSISEAPVIQKGGETSLAVLNPKSTTGELPQTIKFYGKSDPTGCPAYKIEWEINCNDGEWLPFATTKHQVYVTHAKPVSIAVNRESLFLIACDKATGETDDFKIVSEINKYFKDRSVQKIDHVTGYYAGSFLTYYGVGASGNHVLEHGNGECGGWGQFWADVVNVHGFSAVAQNIRGSGYTNKGTVSTNPNAGPGRKAKEFILKNNIVPKPSGRLTPNGLTVHPFCQGGPNATHERPSWSLHTISKVAVNGKTYYVDPSYGTGMGEGLAKFCMFMAGFLASTDDFGWVPDGLNSDISEL